MYLTLRTGCERHGRKNPLPFPFSQRSHVGNLRQTIQGKGVIHKRVETAGVYPLVRPRGVSALPPAAGRGESPRSAERNSPLRFSEKDCRPDRVNRVRGSSTPLSWC